MNVDSLPTPELDKMRSVHNQSQSQGEILDWLINEKGLTLCTTDKYNLFCPDYTSIERLLAEFHGIDLDEVEKERRAILTALSSESDR